MSAAVLRRIVRFVSSLILAALALFLLSAVTPSHARSMFWSESRFWWGDFRLRYPPRRTKPDLTKKQLQDTSKGPLQIIVSIADQRISLYENGALIARSSVSTGVERHPTPLGVFSVISRHKWHSSNIYSGAPMPYMQRITWSGIALHAGELPGYPASHGCIRLKEDFAIRLWHLSKRGTRVIIAPEDVSPLEITHAQLFVRKPQVASASPEVGIATLASNDNAAAGTTHLSLGPSTDERAKTPDPPSARVAPRKVVPVSVFVSRHAGRLFARRGFKPLFDVPITIRDPAEPIGTHVFSVMESQNESTATRWTVVSIPERSSPGKNSSGSHKEAPREPQLPGNANAALERIDIPQDVADRISELLTPGSSLIISDHGISRETGKDTDFIVLTR